MEARKPRVAIVDYSLGNLFSVKHACDHVGLHGFITSSKTDILAADAVILPGVGAYSDAMENLRRLDLVGPLRDLAQSPRPLIGICLGQQLLMTESYEFGRHQGLGIIEGPVVRFENPQGPHGLLKVPQVGWNRIVRPSPSAWQGSALEGLADGEYMYFVHSFYVKPVNAAVVLSTTQYGHITFCSSLRYKNVTSFQFHPERSGLLGMKIYENLAKMIAGQIREVKELSNAA
jgi:imidazole glycerol-phosphate synthase subunit HisH